MFLFNEFSPSLYGVSLVRSYISHFTLVLIISRIKKPAPVVCIAFIHYSVRIPVLQRFLIFLFCVLADFMKAKKRPAACRKFCKLMKNDSVYNNNDNAKAGCGYVIGGEGGGGRSDDGVVCEGGGDGGDISGPHGVVSSVRTSRQCLDSDESKGCHKTIRYHHRPVQQPEPSSKKFRLSR